MCKDLDNIIRICICDDDAAIPNQIKGFVEDYFAECHSATVIDIQVCFDGNTLGNLLLAEEAFDLIFLDICLPDTTGIAIADMIRHQIHDRKTQIIYISTEASYAMELFRSKPFDFLIKPICKEECFRALGEFVEYFNEEATLTDAIFFEYTQNRILHRIPQSDILYFESQDKKIIIHTKKRTRIFLCKAI